MNWLTAPTVGTSLASGRNAFGFTRMLLASAVIWSHAYSILSGSVYLEPLKQTTGYTLGEHAVNGFFVISGLLVAASFDRRGLKPYLAARFLRIFPGLAGATLFSAFILGACMTTLPLATYLSSGQMWNFIRLVLTDLKSANLLPGVFERNPHPFVMATVWTLKYEVFCYVGLEVLGALGVLRQGRLAAAFVLALWLAMAGLHLYFGHGEYRGQTTLRLVFLFGFGSAAYALRGRLRLSVPLAVGLVVLAALLARTPLFTPAMLLAEAYGVLVLALGVPAHFMPEPKNDISYGIYLYGWPLQQMIQALWPGLSVALFIALSFLFTLPVALASWRLIEKPFLRFKAQSTAKPS